MADVVYSGTTLAEMLTLLTGATGPLAAATIMLAENEGPIQPTAAFADLVPASYGGYANSAVVKFGTVHIDKLGRGLVFSDAHEFKPTDASKSSVVTNVVLVDPTGQTIFASYFLDTPLNFSTPSDVQLIVFPLYLEQPSEGLPDVIP